MHVGYVLKKFPRISETFILDEILELERQGVEVSVFSLNRPDDGRFHRKLADVASSVRYPEQAKSQDHVDGLAAALDVLRRRREDLWAELEALLASRRRDVWNVLRQGLAVGLAAQGCGVQHLHAHFATIATDVARVAGAVAGVSHSFTCHAKDLYRESVDAARFRRLVDGAAAVVTVCQANRRHILSHLAPNAGDRVRAIYNGVDLQRLHPREREPEAEPVVLGVGRLVEKKGFDDLVRATSMLRGSGRPLRCVVLGDGDQRSRLEHLNGETGAAVEFVGATTEEETRRHMARATLLALPCVIGEDGNRDALPTVLLEAMACGLPVISTPVVGVEEILGGGEAGVLVPCREPAVLAAAIGELIDDPARRAALAERGRERAERLFDLRRNVATLRRLFGEVVAGSTADAEPARMVQPASATLAGDRSA